jgi:hypothetical protein
MANEGSRLDQQRSGTTSKRGRGATNVSLSAPATSVRPAARGRMRGIGAKTRSAGKARRTAAARKSTIQAIFLRRVKKWAEDVALALPEQVLADALASPTMRGALATVLTRFSEVKDPSVADLWEEALDRGAAAKEALRQQSGGFEPTSWVARHLGISRQAVDKRRRAGRLLAFESGGGAFAYPRCQFTSEGVLPGLGAALAAFEVENPWERLSALVSPSPALSGKSVVDVLRSSRKKEERETAFAVLRDFLQ